MVYTFGKDMTLKAAGAIKMAVDEGRHAWPTARTMCTLTWGTRVITRSQGKTARLVPLPECERQGNVISALVKVAEEWLRGTEGVEQGTWAVGAIRHARYRRGE